MITKLQFIEPQRLGRRKGLGETDMSLYENKIGQILID